MKNAKIIIFLNIFFYIFIQIIFQLLIAHSRAHSWWSRGDLHEVDWLGTEVWVFQCVLLPRKIGELELDFENPTWKSNWDFEKFTVKFYKLLFIQKS